VGKNEHTLLKSCFNPTLEFTLEPELDLELPLRLDHGLFSFSALNPCLDLDFKPDLDGPLHPLVDLNPDLLKLRLALLAMSISALPLKPKKRHQHLPPLL